MWRNVSFDIRRNQNWRLYLFKNVLGKCFCEKFSFFWYFEKKFFWLWWNLFGRAVKTAFHVSSGTFYKKMWKSFLRTFEQKVRTSSKNFSTGLSKLRSTCPEEYFGSIVFPEIFWLFTSFEKHVGFWAKIFRERSTCPEEHFRVF